MRLRKRKRSQANGWRVVKRCVLFFTAICVIPVLLVVLVATEHYMKAERHSSFSLHQFNIGDSIKTEPLLGHNMSMVAERFEKRRKYLKHMCKMLGLDKIGNDTLHKPNTWEFLINQKHHLLWCNVFKAASTSWMYNFNILAGYSPNYLKRAKVAPMNLARLKYPRPSLEILKKGFNDSISFLIVRHPLERLLSAYRDKLQYALPYTKHKKLGQSIIAKYRKARSSIKQTWPTFPEFVQYLVDTAKSGGYPDMHWAPIVQFCTPCMYDFQFIAHTETLQEDQTYIIKKAGLEHHIQPQWENPGKGHTKFQIVKYYTQLTRSQILQLYHIYRFDFDLFNYSLSGFLELGQPDKDPSTLLAAITMKDSNFNPIPQVNQF